MKPFTRPFALLTVLLVLLVPAFAISSSGIGDVVKAQIIINQVLQIVEKYRQFTVELEAPVPLPDNSGKFMLPYKASGELTEWANKALHAQAGALVGEKAGEAAGKAVASKIPFGGLASGLMKKKGKEIGAVTAIGGAEFIKKTSELSFHNLDEYAVFLHVHHSGDSDYKLILATAMAVYPDLETRFDGAIKNAFSKAAKTPKKTG